MLVEVCVCVFIFALYKELIGSYLIKKKFDDIKASRYSKRHEKESKFFFRVCV